MWKCCPATFKYLRGAFLSLIKICDKQRFGVKDHSIQLYGWDLRPAPFPHRSHRIWKPRSAIWEGMLFSYRQVFPSILLTKQAAEDLLCSMILVSLALRVPCREMPLETVLVYLCAFRNKVDGEICTLGLTFLIPCYSGKCRACLTLLGRSKHVARADVSALTHQYNWMEAKRGCTATQRPNVAAWLNHV